jgi:hypothetical protein
VRGLFNKLADVYRGPVPTVGVAFALKAAAVPCRMVPQEHVFQLQVPFGDSTAWLTLDQLPLVGPLVTEPDPGIFTSDYRAADQVIVSSHPGIPWVVCRGEFVEPDDRPGYWRYQLVLPASIGVTPRPPSPPVPPVPPVPPTVPPGPGSSGGYGWSCPAPGGIWVQSDPDSPVPPYPLCTDPGYPPFPAPPEGASAHFDCSSDTWSYGDPP